MPASTCPARPHPASAGRGGRATTVPPPPVEVSHPPPWVPSWGPPSVQMREGDGAQPVRWVLSSRELHPPSGRRKPRPAGTTRGRNPPAFSGRVAASRGRDASDPATPGRTSRAKQSASARLRRVRSVIEPNPVVDVAVDPAERGAASSRPGPRTGPSCAAPAAAGRLPRPPAGAVGERTHRGVLLVPSRSRGRSRPSGAHRRTEVDPPRVGVEREVPVGGAECAKSSTRGHCVRPPPSATSTTNGGRRPTGGRRREDLPGSPSSRRAPRR